MMDLKNLIIERGEMNFEKKFISVRILKEALMSRFRLKVIEETSKCLSCKIFRVARLFGGPAPFPNPSFNFEIFDEGEDSKIRYEFISYDYPLLLVSALCFLVLVPKFFGSSSFLYGILEGLSVSGGIMVLGYFAIKLDSIYFVHLIRKNIKKEIIDV
jgi:hypothetical protein